MFKENNWVVHHELQKLISPFASYGVEGITTFKPGVEAIRPSRLSACISGVCTPPPNGERIVTGALNAPPYGNAYEQVDR